MGRSFYSVNLSVFSLLLFATVALSVLFAISQTRNQSVAEADAALTQAQQIQRVLLQRTDAQLASIAATLTREPFVSEVVNSNDISRLAPVLNGQISLGTRAELMLLDRSGRPLANSRVRYPNFQLDPAAFSSSQGLFVELAQEPYRFVFASIQDQGRAVWLAIGMPYGAAMAETIKSLTGVDTTLRVLGPPVRVSASTRIGELENGSRILTVDLGSGGTIALRTEFSVPRSELVSSYISFAIKLAAATLALTALAIGIAALLLARVVQRLFRNPVQALRDGVDRVRQGIYTEQVPAAGSGLIGRLVRAFNDMQEEIGERESRIVHHAEYDSLTGLTNRAVVSERLRAAFGRAQRSGASMAALLIDIERFGDINGALGTETGDSVLKEVARRLASNTRATDILARVGGDEFLIVVEDMDDKLATHLTAFLADTLQKPISIGDQQISLRVRIGVALYPGHCETPEGLRRLANVALGTAKETGQSVVMYAPGQDERHLRDLAILNDLQTAIAEGQLSLKYQPKLDIKTRTVEAVEALVRWNHPQLGFLPPDEFIGLLEENNKIQPLTDWVIKTAIQQAGNWKTRGYDLSIAVNLSANDLLDHGLADRISALLHHYLVEPSRLSVEVTESAVMRDPEHASEVLHSLRKIGLKIAIDDFGTGQTSLSLLRLLPLTELKIDKAFVQELKASSGDAIIVKSTIDLGHNMGLVVVAEGVETQYAWNLLKSYGCDIVQGYLITKPLDPDQLESWYLRLQATQASRLDFSFIEKEITAEKGEPQTISDVIEL